MSARTSCGRERAVRLLGLSEGQTHLQLSTKQPRNLEAVLIPDMCSLLFCLDLVAFVVLVRKPRLSPHLSFLMVHRSILCVSFYLHPGGRNWEVSP